MLIKPPTVMLHSLFCMFFSHFLSILYCSVCLSSVSVCCFCFTQLVSLLFSDWSLCSSAYSILASFCLSASTFFSVSAFVCLPVFLSLSLSLYTVFFSPSLSICPLNVFFFSVSHLSLLLFLPAYFFCLNLSL